MEKTNKVLIKGFMYNKNKGAGTVTRIIENNKNISYCFEGVIGGITLMQLIMTARNNNLGLYISKYGLNIFSYD